MNLTTIAQRIHNLADSQSLSPLSFHCIHSIEAIFNFRFSSPSFIRLSCISPFTIFFCRCYVISFVSGFNSIVVCLILCSFLHTLLCHGGWWYFTVPRQYHSTTIAQKSSTLLCPRRLNREAMNQLVIRPPLLLALPLFNVGNRGVGNLRLHRAGRAGAR